MERRASPGQVHIFEEFTDQGKSGLISEGRHKFNQIVGDWLIELHDFEYVL